MQIINLKIKNFRGIKEANLHFEGHTVLVGDNNVGKSTVFEAMNLVLGPDRSSSSTPIIEHDFYASKYLLPDDEVITIYIEATIIGLTEEQKRHFRANHEYWNIAEKSILEEGPPEQVDDENIEEALRVCFEGKYSIPEDDFEGETYFCFPPESESSQRARFWKTDKRKCGFLYLRALRTGARALSMERGSLLDIILRVRDLRPKIWEEVIDQLSGVPVAEDPELGLSGVLKSVQESIQEYVPNDWGDDPQLRVSNLTRDQLRKTLTVFMASGAHNDDSPHYAPYYYQGTGTTNMLVLALLSMIADEKSTVIFAMEEPETAIPPYAQKRIVDAVQSKSNQAFFTTHSPYVLEEFDPRNILVLKRDGEGILEGMPFRFPSTIKPKAYKVEVRKRFAEAMLSRRVLIAEGITEAIAYNVAAKRLADVNPENYHSLDALGIVVFDAKTDTQVKPLAELFTGLGKVVYTIFDQQNDDALTESIEANSEIAYESPYKGFELLLVTEIPCIALREFAHSFIDAGEWPTHLDGIKPHKNTSDNELRTNLKTLLKWGKGRGLAGQLLYGCDESTMPLSIRTTLKGISDNVRGIQRQLRRLFWLLTNPWKLPKNF